ncbi:hypothetical protein M2160_002414 [Streptomyces sp. SAI-117]|uniref:hypothetical protein n=1 Tax=Streptomyces sp. SAI-117 TaxID=2940546 RepID=UPI002474DD1F|nr:hypothetical protein [Streptomyces sp. SAI-117]MDH6567393.1 hypothetical protein [Streptomyces sp. SAI-117]
MSYPPPPGGPGGTYPQGQGGWPPQQTGVPYPPQAAPGPYGYPPQPAAPVQGWPGPPHTPYPQLQPQPQPPGAGGGSGGQGGSGLKKAVIGVVVLAVLAVLGIGGLAAYRAFGDGELPTAAGGAQGEQLLDEDDIEELLDGRSQALRSGDEDTYLAPFTGAAKDTQKNLYENLRKIPFAQAEYSVLSKTGTGTDEYGDGATVALDVAFVHKIQDVDVRPVSEWYRWIIKRDSKDAEPRITKVGPAPGAFGAKNYVFYPAPWDLYADMHVVKKAHTLTISDKKHAADTDRYAPYIEKAAADDIALWKADGPEDTETPTGFVTVLEPDRKTYSSLYGSPYVEWEAGQSVAMPTFDAGFGGDKKDLEYGGARIKMDMSGSRFTNATYWPKLVKEISHHEFAHAIVQPLEAASGGFAAESNTRWWVVEGFADYMAFRFDTELGEWNVRNDVTGKEFSGKLPGSPGFGDEVGTGYTVSYLAIRFIAEKNGDTAALRFVAEHYRAPGRLDQQLREATGMGESQFQAAWASYVRSHS